MAERRNYRNFDFGFLFITITPRQAANRDKHKISYWIGGGDILYWCFDAGDKRNGTCYTKEECKDRGGKESKTCAEGFGVCCVLELKCGKSSSDNNTYLAETTPTASTGCTYTICPMASTICRIRYDFTVNLFTTLRSSVSYNKKFWNVSQVVQARTNY